MFSGNISFVYGLAYHLVTHIYTKICFKSEKKVKLIIISNTWTKITSVAKEFDTKTVS